MCVECWQGLDCLVAQFLTRVSNETTFAVLFEETVFTRLKDSAETASSHLSTAVCLVSSTGKSDWKTVQVSDGCSSKC